MFFFPMAITKAWAEQEKEYLNHLRNAWGQNFAHMHGSNNFKKISSHYSFCGDAKRRALRSAFEGKAFPCTPHSIVAL